MLFTLRLKALVLRKKQGGKMNKRIRGRRKNCAGCHAEFYYKGGDKNE